MNRRLYRRHVAGLSVAALVLGATGITTLPAQAGGKAPKIVRAVMLDRDRDQRVDAVRLTYSTKISHRKDTDGKYPFVVKGYSIKSVAAAKATKQLTIILKEKQKSDLTVTPAVAYARTKSGSVRNAKSEATAQTFRKTLPVLARLRVSNDGPGEVRTQDGRIVCGETCSALYKSGARVVLEALPSVTAHFEGWTGPCSASTETTCSIRVRRAQNVVARFISVPEGMAPVKLLTTGPGTTSIAATNLSCPPKCVALVPVGTTVKAVATPDNGASLARWGGACNGTESQCTLTITQATTIETAFGYRIDITVAGTGAGTVTSSDGTVTCTAECSVVAPAGSVVTLRGDADQGSTFEGWSGDCGPSGECVLIMTAARAIGATFNATGGGAGLPIPLPTELPDPNIPLPIPGISISEPGLPSL